MANLVYDICKDALARGQMDLVGGDLRVLLTSSAYISDAGHQHVADVVGELVAANYVRKVLAGKALATNGATHTVTFTASNVTWTSLGSSSPFRAVVFKQVTGDADSVLVACVDLSSPPAANGGDYQVAWDAVNGIFRMV